MCAMRLTVDIVYNITYTMQRLWTEKHRKKVNVTIAIAQVNSIQFPSSSVRRFSSGFFFSSIILFSISRWLDTVVVVVCNHPMFDFTACFAHHLSLSCVSFVWYNWFLLWGAPTINKNMTIEIRCEHSIAKHCMAQIHDMEGIERPFISPVHLSVQTIIIDKHFRSA